MPETQGSQTPRKPPVKNGIGVLVTSVSSFVLITGFFVAIGFSMRKHNMQADNTLQSNFPQNMLWLGLLIAFIISGAILYLGWDEVRLLLASRQSVNRQAEEPIEATAETADQPAAAQASPKELADQKAFLGIKKSIQDFLLVMQRAGNPGLQAATNAILTSPDGTVQVGTVNPPDSHCWSTLDGRLKTAHVFWLTPDGAFRYVTSGAKWQDDGSIVYFVWEVNSNGYTPTYRDPQGRELPYPAPSVTEALSHIQQFLAHVRKAHLDA